MTEPPVDVAATADPVAAVLAAATDGRLVALRTSGTTSRPRAVVRTVASWTDSFPHVSALAGIDAGSRVCVPGPLSATMNLFAAVHARWSGAPLVGAPAEATHVHLTPAALTGALQAGTDLRGRTLVVAGDRLHPALAARAEAAGARVAHYYGAAELSFVAWGTHADDLRPFPDVEVEVRDGRIWARSPFLSRGYAAGAEGPFDLAGDGFATVGDRGRLAGGVLTVTGRGGDAVLTGGVTVLVGEVEEVLRRATGADALVVGVPHPRLGAVVAAVLADPAAVGAARAAARAELAPAQRPRRWFALPHLPTTGAGKVDRAAVAELVAEGRLAPVGAP
ncbi:AMP-binding protein [Trujillonella endophytica]|uniref:Acyl-CoA synthetase (AMP-forming)/AMP-acid ligase II n=1 Tax=Trujillonella endophytica TaxID=673521 RepID=A0A1H8R3U6_9ACTN|nr:AMP-binding protein [Trujillella endophytica]SEO61050.1 Acyl-CoA synthetase (AMP-forming)/AMP-acid ligase II [Trujillella endophytica]